MAAYETAGLAAQASSAGARSARLNIRLEEADLARIRQSARLSGVSVSEYVRRRCLDDGGRPRIIVDTSELRAIHVQLRRNGNNLNQIARELNTRHKPNDVEELLRGTLRQTAAASEEATLLLAQARQSI